MPASAYRILMFSMSSYSEWEHGVRNRNYYIVWELLKRPEVAEIIMVEYLPVQWRKKLAAFLFVSLGVYKTNRQIIGKDYGGILCQIGDKLKVYTAYCMSGLLSRLTRLIKNHNDDQGKQIIWSYFPLYSAYLNAFQNSLIVFDAVDDWRAHPSCHKYANTISSNYALISEKADCIFTVSGHLKEHVFRNALNTHWIPNGVDAGSIEPAPIRKEKTRIGYIGTIQSRVDFDLVCFLTERHKDKQFVFVGPVWKDAEAYRVASCGNVIFTGPVPHNELAHYLTTFDAAIIPYKINALTTSMNPMKFYEYLAAGLPVVSTQKLSLDAELLYYAYTPLNFSAAIDRALAENTPERAAKRRAYALKNSWERRVEEMMRIIKK